MHYSNIEELLKLWEESNGYRLDNEFLRIIHKWYRNGQDYHKLLELCSISHNNLDLFLHNVKTDVLQKKISKSKAHKKVRLNIKRRKSNTLFSASSNSQNSGCNPIKCNNLYTDVFAIGVCLDNGQGNRRAGIGVWFGDNHRLNVSQPVIGQPTPKVADIQAVTIAAKQARSAGVKYLNISTNSAMIESYLHWLPKWKKNGWITSNGWPVIHKDDLIELEKSLAPLKVSWHYIKDRSTVCCGNKRARELAIQGCTRYQRR